MKPLSKVIFFLIVVAFFASTFLENKDELKPENTASINKQEMYSARGVDNTWPTLKEGQSSVSDNLNMKNYYLVFDASGSMENSQCSSGQSKIAVAKNSVIEFIKKIPADANIGLNVFDSTGSYERVSLGQQSREKIIAEIQRAQAGGGTPLESAIDTGYHSLSKQAVSQLGYGEYHMVVITDGEASSGEDPQFTVKQMLTRSPIVLHTIGFCISGQHSLNQAGYTLYKAAGNPAELTKGLDSVLAEAPDFNVDAFEGQPQ